MHTNSVDTWFYRPGLTISTSVDVVDLGLIKSYRPHAHAVIVYCTQEQCASFLRRQC